MSTVWREIPGWPGYMVSDTGAVIGKRGKYLAQHVDKDGYWRVYGRAVHRLMCLAFHGLPPEGRPWALHRDGDNQHNVPSNLYWGSPGDNSADRVSHGKHRVRHKVGGHEHEIEQLVASGMTHTAVAKIYGVHQTTVSDLIAKRRKYA